MKKKHRLSRLFYNDKFVAAFSILAALIIWAVVTIELTPETTVVVTDIPVSMDLEELEDNLGLTAFGTTDFKASVTVTGKRYIVEGDDIKDKIVVSANTSGVTAAGTTNLTVSADKADDSDDFSIDGCNISQVTVYFDYLKEEEFDVEVRTDDLNDNIPAGYYADDPYITDAPTIKVSGPESDISKINGIYAELTLDGPVTETQTVKANIKTDVTDSVNSSYMTFTKAKGKAEVSEVTITLPVYKVADLPTAVGFTGKPSGITDDSIVSYTVSPSTVQLGISESRLDSVTTFVVKKIDFSALTAGENVFEVTAEEAETGGVVILDGTGSFTITVEVSGVDEVTADMPATIEGTNTPDGVNITSIVPDDSTITLVGPSESVEAVQVDSLNIAADLSSLEDAAPGTYTVPVTFSDENCWAYGEYTATVTVE